MQDKGAYGSVPTRLKVADILVNYGKDVSFTRNGLIKSPFRNERTPSFHIMPEGYGWSDRPNHATGKLRPLIRAQTNRRDQERRTFLRAAKRCSLSKNTPSGSRIQSHVVISIDRQ